MGAEPVTTKDRGIRIDLARNFRSRSEVVDGVNNVFRAIMREKAAEMDYDERAELVCGASYPPSSEGGSPQRYAVEFALLDRGTAETTESDSDSGTQQTVTQRLKEKMASRGRRCGGSPGRSAGGALDRQSDHSSQRIQSAEEAGQASPSRYMTGSGAANGRLLGGISLFCSGRTSSGRRSSLRSCRHKEYRPMRS